jgi:2-keto-4-pentenoate hydratase
MELHNDIIEAFVQARDARPVWPAAALQRRPDTIDDGYILQAAVHRQLAARGDRQVGWKVGATSAPGQRAFGITEPIYAGLFASGQSATLAEALARPLAKPSLECEIAVVLRSDLDGSDLSTTALANAIGACHIACEVIDNRYGDPMTVGVPSLIVDDFFQAGFVIGAAHMAWRSQDLETVEATIDIDGQRVAGAVRDVISALAALRWLARKLSEAGQGLHAGDIVLTGSITVPTPIALPATDVTLAITGFAPLSLR